MKNFILSNIKQFRHERKFYIKEMAMKNVEAILKFHPAIFREIYCQRAVNNIYFDLFNLQQYFDNINGVDKRLKVRIRWYGELLGYISDPILELKFKHNLHIAKLSYPLKPFVLDNSFSIDTMRKVFRESVLHETLKLHLLELNLSLLNSYDRKYFLSSNRKLRVTIDANMTAYRLFQQHNYFLNKHKNSTDVILELKYNKPYDEVIEQITNNLPFRMTRSSKYVDGVEKVDLQYIGI